MLRNRLSRRHFTIATLAAAAGLMGASAARDEAMFNGQLTAPQQDSETKIYSGCAAHNCSGRCVTKVHVVNNTIKYITTDERPDTYDIPQMRACLRCRAYKTRIHHPGRLRYPLIYDEAARKRGNVRNFRKATWEEAMAYIKDKYTDIRKRHGAECVYRHAGSGANSGQLNGIQPFERVLNALGGHIYGWGGYSNHALSYIGPKVLGTNSYFTLSSTPENWMHTRTLLLWGAHTATTTGNTNALWWLTRAKERGMKIYYIGPVYESTAELADEWVKIRPGTDGAMMLSMLHEMIVNNWVDRESIENFSVGFYDDPNGKKPMITENSSEYLSVPAGRSLSAYVMGHKLLSENASACTYPASSISRYDYKKDFYTEKTPEWAENITGVPAAKIRKITKAYCTQKPGMFYASVGLQRQPSGVDNVWLSYALALASGNWGQPGTGASWFYFISGSIPEKGPVTYDSGINPVPHPARFSRNLWIDAIQSKGGKHSQYNDSDIRGMTEPVKIIFSIAGDALVNQHMDVHSNISALEDRTNVELIVVTDNFMTPSAKYADVILPGTTHYEQEDMVLYHNNIIYQSKALDALAGIGEVKSHFEMGEMLADTFGLKDVNGENLATGGKSPSQWLEDIWNSAPRPISFEQWKRDGIYTEGPQGAFTGAMAIREHGRCDEKVNFGTRTGYIELFCRAAVEEYENRGQGYGAPGHANVDPEGDPEMYPIPRYVPYLDEYRETLLKGCDLSEYPFYCIGSHSLYRTHSSNSNNPALRELYKVDKEGRSLTEITYGENPFTPHYSTDQYEPLWMNPTDVSMLNLTGGDRVKVTSALTGKALYASVAPTVRCTTGVVVLRQGSWFDPLLVDNEIIDQGGCMNTLTTGQPTRNDRGPSLMLALVKIEKA